MKRKRKIPNAHRQNVVTIYINSVFYQIFDYTTKKRRQEVISE